MADLKKKTAQELDKGIRELREKLREFRFSVAGSKTRNVREGRNLKRDVARHLTEQSLRAHGDNQ